MSLKGNIEQNFLANIKFIYWLVFFAEKVTTKQDVFGTPPVAAVFIGVCHFLTCK